MERNPQRKTTAAVADANATQRARLRWAGLAAGTVAALLAWSEARGEDGVTISHGYSFFGDLKYPADFEHFEYVNPDAPQGGEISQWAQGTFDSFNPYTRKGRAGALGSIGHERILTTAADDINASYCLLCTTMEYPDSKDWVIFNLREDVRFSDGRPWTADDLVFTHALFMEQGLPSFRAAFGAQIESVEALGPHRVKFTFTPEAPRRDVIELAGLFPAFSQSWFEETGARLDETTLTPFLGTGEYQLESFDVNRRVIYAKNPDYWGRDLPINVGRGNFDRIRVEYFADSNAAFEAFKAGTYTMRIENSSKSWATQYEFPAIARGHAVKAELPDGGISSGQSFIFNLRREKFQDPRVREAIGLMFNFEWSNETLFFGLYDRTTSFWGNSPLEATGVPDASDVELLQPLVDEGLLDAAILTDEVRMPATSGERQLDRRNSRRASALLDEAGWIVGDDGMRRKDGELLTVEFLESSPTFDRVINPYVQNLRAIGVDAKLERVDPAQETERSRRYDFDMTTHQFAMTFEPSTGLKQWFGSEAVNESSRNLMGLEDPAVDRLIDLIVAAESKEELEQGVRVLDRVLRAKGFWVPQWFKPTHWMAYYDMYEYPEPLPPFARGELDFWWYNADKAAELRAAGALN
ncbi:MAG: extracellular solute-binding protein [Pseudomonadota bacterium]